MIVPSWSRWTMTTAMCVVAMLALSALPRLGFAAPLVEPLSTDLLTPVDIVPNSQGQLPGQTNLYVSAQVGLPLDNITESKQVTSLPSRLISVVIEPQKPPTAVTAQFQNKQMVTEQIKDSPRYEVTVTMPSKTGDYPLRLRLDYKSSPSEVIDMTLTVAPLGKAQTALNKEQISVSGAVVTLTSQQPDNTFQPWNPGKTNQANPMVTDEKGQFGFVVPPGTYQLSVAADTTYRAFTSEAMLVGPTNQLLTPLLTLQVAQPKSVAVISWRILAAAIGVLVLLRLTLPLYQRRHHH